MDPDLQAKLDAILKAQACAAKPLRWLPWIKWGAGLLFAAALGGAAFEKARSEYVTKDDLKAAIAPLKKSNEDILRLLLQRTAQLRIPGSTHASGLSLTGREPPSSVLSSVSPTR